MPTELLVSVCCLLMLILYNSWLALVPDSSRRVYYVLYDYKLFLNNPDIVTKAIYLLILVDLLTKYAWYHYSSDRKKERTVEFLNELWEQFRRENIEPPKILHSDNGGEFKNDLVNGWCDEHGVDQHHPLPGHPQADGCVERCIQTISTLLSELCPELKGMENKYNKDEKYPCNWVQQCVFVIFLNCITSSLPEVFEEYNNTPHSTTGFAPCWLMYGQIPKFFDVPATIKPIGYTSPEQDRDIALKRLQQRGEQLAVHNNNMDFAIGETVLVQLCSRAKDAVEWHSVATVVRRETNDQYIYVKYLNNNAHRPKGFEDSVNVKLLYHIKNDINIMESLVNHEVVETNHGNIGLNDIVVYIDELILKKCEKDEVYYLVRYAGNALDSVIWIRDDDISKNQLTDLERMVRNFFFYFNYMQVKEYVPIVLYTYSSDKKLSDIRSALTSCHGDIFTYNFRHILNKTRNFVLENKFPFYLNTSTTEPKSHFIIPIECDNLDVALLTLIITTQVNPDIILCNLLQNEQPVAYDNETMEPSLYLYRLCRIVKEGKIPDSMRDMTELLDEFIHKAIRRYQHSIGQSNFVLDWQLAMNTGSHNEQVIGFNLFEFGMDDNWRYHCKRCGEPIQHGDLIREMLVRFHHIPLQQFIQPRVTDEWDGTDIGLRFRCKQIPFKCPLCGSTDKFVLDYVPDLSKSNKFPLIIIVKRFIPDVEPVLFGTGDLHSEIPSLLNFGAVVYKYSGWTARLGRKSKLVTYCYLLVLYY